jgi:hypothetical protein
MLLIQQHHADLKSQPHQLRLGMIQSVISIACCRFSAYTTHCQRQSSVQGPKHPDAQRQGSKRSQHVRILPKFRPLGAQPQLLAPRTVRLMLKLDSLLRESLIRRGRHAQKSVQRTPSASCTKKMQMTSVILISVDVPVQKQTCNLKFGIARCTIELWNL